MKLSQRLAGVFTKAASYLSVPSQEGAWYSLFDSYGGAYQQAVEVRPESVLAYHAVFSCISLVANDIGKLRVRLVEKDANGIWSETESPAFSPVLRRPNHYQNAIQFREWWITSKLTRGNAYALKQRDSRGVVTSLYLLDPSKATPLVAPNGDVFYRLDDDNLTNIEEQITVPASEIIHDRMNCLYHPLVGLSPIFACGLAATQGLKIQNNSTRFFQNMSRPSGILTAPGAISNETAARLKEQWETNYGGENIGKVAVLGDALKYDAITITPVDAQLVEQLRWTAEVVCSCFHVPPFKIGIGQMPTYQNGEMLNGIYYSDCLQSLIEQFEACMDDGLGIGMPREGRTLGVELDLDSLLRMDSSTLIKALSEGVGGGIMAPNEARRRIDLKPISGGDSVFMQQQNYSLEALAKRDAAADPFGTAPTQPPAAAPMPKPDDDESMSDDESMADEEMAITAAVLKKIEQRRMAA